MAESTCAELPLASTLKGVRRDGTNPSHVEMSDVLCDFCHSTWTDDRSMVEGHLGACVCGTCVTEAYRACVLADIDDRLGAPTLPCTMCREDREQSCRRSPAYPEAVICLRCIKMAAKALSRDADAHWQLPVS